MKISFGNTFVNQKKLSPQKKMIFQEIQDIASKKRGVSFVDKSLETGFYIKGRQANMPLMEKQVEIKVSKPKNETLIQEVLTANEIPFTSDKSSKGKVDLNNMQKLSLLV